MDLSDSSSSCEDEDGVCGVCGVGGICNVYVCVWWGVCTELYTSDSHLYLNECT